MRNSNQHSFAKVPSIRAQRSSFDRSKGLMTTIDPGYLYPILVEEILPGDTMSCRAETFGRLATPLHPILDNMFVETFFFAVPMRLLWENWEKFNGQQDNPGDSTAYVIPTMSEPVGGAPSLGISDYLGIPTLVPDLEHSAMFHRACNKIWNEWFRDENLQQSIVENKDDGPDADTDYVLQKRGKRKDYFTGCLPWTQKGTEVTIPLGTTAPVVSAGNNRPSFIVGGTSGLELQGIGGNNSVNMDANAGGSGNQVIFWDDPKLETDLTAAAAATINTLRQAGAIQRLYENDARGGTRYTEVLRSHFGVISPDARLQRSEYLGGGIQTINVNQVPQTSETDAGTPQGNLAAYGTTQGSGHGFTKSFTEHCVVLGFVSVRAAITYQTGLARMFSRSTRFEFYWPELAHLGEQAVLNKEIYAQGSDDLVADEAVFGYQPRFDDMRYNPSTVTGQMRSNHPTSLDTWHLAQDFANLPVLDSDFIEEDPPFDRVVAVTSEPKLLFNAWFNITHARPMPTNSIPGHMARF